MDIDDKKNMERAFLLTVDPTNGQEVAAKAGFTPPSPSVAFMETRSVLREWTKIKTLGLLDDVEQFSEWYMDMISSVVGHELPEMYRLQHQATLMAFFTASLLALHRDGLVTIKDMDKVHLVEVLVDPATKKPVPPKETYSDLIAEYEHMLQDKRLVDEPVVQEDSDEQ